MRSSCLAPKAPGFASATERDAAGEAAQVIREATVADRASVQRLYEILCPGEPVDVQADRIDQLIQNTNNYLFVYDDAGVIVGTAFLALCLDPMFGSRPFAVIENLVVDETAQGRGIGAQLFEHLERVCVDRHCSKIMLLSNVKRASGHAFFRRMGCDDTVAKGFKKYFDGHRPAYVSE